MELLGHIIATGPTRLNAVSLAEKQQSLVRLSIASRSSTFEESTLNINITPLRVSREIISEISSSVDLYS